MYRILGIVAFGLGGLLATLVLRQPTAGLVFAESFAGSQVHVLYDSVVATATAGILVAVLIAGFVMHRGALLTATGLGLVVIGLFAILGGTGLPVKYGVSIAAGGVLGGLARLSGDRSDLRRRATPSATALASGVIVGVLLGASVRELRFSPEKPRRYADYLPAAHSYLTGPTDLFIAVLAGVALATLVGYLATGGGRNAVGPAPGQVSLIGGCLLPVAALIAHWRLRESLFSGSGIGLHTWVFGYLLLAAAVILAVRLPGRSGLLWVAITAVVAGHVVYSSLGSDSVVVLIALVAAVIGALVGRLVAQPLWGMAALAACTLLAFAGESLVVLAALLFVVPMASAFTVVASLPSDATVTASALGIPAVLIATVGVQYGWTAYTPLTGADDGLDFVTISGHTTLVLSAISLLVCGVAGAVIARRSPEPVDAPLT